MASTDHIQPLALTMGEPAGVGPELIARLWQARKDLGLAPFLYVGAPSAITAVAPDVPLESTATGQINDAMFDRALPCYPIDLKAPIDLGSPNHENGYAVIESIKRAVSFAQDGTVSGIVTAPIQKSILYQAGFDAPGHTEYLARLCGEADDFSVMMLTAQDLRVVPVTIHTPLKDVANQLTADKIIHAGLVLHHDLQRRFGIKAPRLAVAGLNPHASESGTIGMEEATKIMPAIWSLRDHGVTVTDPLPADTLFHKEARESYDAVLCMYHDQALIPVKMLDFWSGVNCTLGLPLIRTSPDHGTALELAGTGKARTGSMLAAVKLAENMVLCEARVHD